MSNIYGIIGRNTDLNSTVNYFPDSTRFLKKFKSDKVLVYTEIESRNCYCGKLEPEGSFVVSGIGLEDRIFEEKDWHKILSTSKPEIDYPDGHYVVITITDKSIKFYTDPTGIRDLFILHSRDIIYFSTRLDWLANFQEMKINFSEFSTRWLLFNQLSHDSVIHGVMRITAGRKAEVNLNSMSLDIDETCMHDWLSDKPYSFDVILEKLKKVVLTPFNRDEKISVSLSGGLDSRVILSYLLDADNSNWDTHTFGEDRHPDVIIAGLICKDLNIPHSVYKHEEYSTYEAVKLLKDYTCQTIVNNSASAIMQLDLYDNLAERDHVIIDGGFGEIWRRDFFNRLLYKGKKDLIEKNAEQIFKHIVIPRADIFNEKINKQMYEGALKQISDLFESNPPIKEIGLGNWLDLIGLKTRLVNYYGPEQTRLDLKLRSYMPFAQKSLLCSLFSIPLSERRNGKLLRKIIKHNFPELRSFPLAKGSFSYPYGLGTVESRVYSVVRKKMEWKLFTDNVRTNFLNRHSEYINDTVNSRNVRECDLYDYSKVKKLADEYYSGNKNLAHDLDWWLSFDEFRRGLLKTRPETL